jgi:hypothetical protein
MMKLSAVAPETVTLSDRLQPAYQKVDAAVAQARQYLRSVGYPAAGWPSS